MISLLSSSSSSTSRSSIGSSSSRRRRRSRRRSLRLSLSFSSSEAETDRCLCLRWCLSLLLLLLLFLSLDLDRDLSTSRSRSREGDLLLSRSLSSFSKVSGMALTLALWLAGLELGLPAIEYPRPRRLARLVLGKPSRIALGPVGALMGTSTGFTTGGCIAEKFPRP